MLFIVIFLFPHSVRVWNLITLETVVGTLLENIISIITRHCALAPSKSFIISSTHLCNNSPIFSSAFKHWHTPNWSHSHKFGILKVLDVCFFYLAMFQGFALLTISSLRAHHSPSQETVAIPKMTTRKFMLNLKRQDRKKQGTKIHKAARRNRRSSPIIKPEHARSDGYNQHYSNATKNHG